MSAPVVHAGQGRAASGISADTIHLLYLHASPFALKQTATTASITHQELDKWVVVAQVHVVAYADRQHAHRLHKSILASNDDKQEEHTEQ